MSVHADSLITFLQLSSGSEEIGENKFEMSLLQATGAGGQKEERKITSKLNKVCNAPVFSLNIFVVPGVQVIQLTGFSDPVYAEAYVNMNQYDIVLDVLVVNQTSDTLQGLTLELATLGESRGGGNSSRGGVTMPSGLGTHNNYN